MATKAQNLADDEKLAAFAKALGVMSTPGVVLDEKVIHSGGVPSKDSIRSWIQSL